MPAGGLRAVYVSGECEIDLARRELRIAGSPVPVGGRAFEILEILVGSAGELVTKVSLMDCVWSGAIVNDNTLQMHISAVRKALGPHRAVLKTESRRGYRLLGSWTARDQGPATVAAPQELRAFERTPGTNILPVVARLIGRSTAVERLLDLVSAYRVVTLTGPGGIGKTVLALEVATCLLGEFEDAAWLVELASLSDPDLVPTAVASVLGLRLGGEQISAEAVARAVGDANLLLVLDNCEHVIDAAAELAECVMRFCPRASVLTTSRELLRIDGEHVYRVPPLDVPEAGERDLEQVLRCGAAELLVARTTALSSDFSPSSDDVPSIAAICGHLDGIPLAIEFAAARAATLGLHQVAAGLSDRFGLLTRGRRTALPRHRTLRAALDWSYDLLSPPERILLCRLSVFAGDFSLDAAGAVAASPEMAPSLIVDGLASLVSKSLVAAQSRDLGTRYRLLETTRAHALEQLDSRCEREELARRHAEYHRDIFERAEAESERRPTAEWLADYRWQIDNLRAALDWAFSPNGDQSIGVALTAAAAPLWLHLSLLEECRSRVEKALAAVEGGAGRDAHREMKLNAALGSVLIYTAEAGAAWTKVGEFAERLGDAEYQLRSLSGLWVFHSIVGAHRVALELAQRFDGLTANQPHAMDRLVGEQMIGVSHFYLGDLARARRHFERVLADYVAPDRWSHFIRFHLHPGTRAGGFLSWALWLQGFPDQALRTSERSVAEARATNHALTLTYALDQASVIALLVGDLAAAERHSTTLLDESARRSLTRWRSHALFFRGVLGIARGDIAEGLRLLHEGVAERGIARFVNLRFIASLIVDSFGRAGRVAEGLAVVEEAIESFEERWLVASLLRSRGELLLLQNAPGATATAEDHFRRALEGARGQGALSWELQAAMSLARLLRDQGRSADALMVLRPVYDRFTEGFDTADLLAAKHLLDG
jgi:predicted ATPase/DNA-binding winged helix-turn-helix (wHTH) protein